MNDLLQIAIDGPASAGKSTVAKMVAHELGYIYCDTGAMYRAVTWAAIKRGIKLDDNLALEHMLSQIKISFAPSVKGQRVFVDQDEVTDDIRLPEIANNVSTVAAQLSVREALTKRQQEIAINGGIVMDGRDIGTTVLPDAQVKIFLVASVKERALRRFKENKAKGIKVNLETLEQEIAERDRKDSTRAVSPLVQAADAIKVDTTILSVEQVVAKIMKIIQKKAKNG
ncbi:cytidylate kinase [Liquorilactobacillus sucicola DSM 21376 = JCM 15457]|uniref:Cytidylate kinase n=1 Tax=Liquorilactobacillus sucicola DSM 21376 = JCM 15457 TaxID=1423806 RepID=A0A023CV89_9LACO|nr:(d)CMP kinase [Liquorilactobacillus sucicola]KRN05443.1 cytidylate kinase [Liquorilactobacillus sucicola DSM 21376 = JCM 15457]GAJ25521.1 cytidylate kinase [Liquorilactobacillus sucicola DSM 21376 = JCM 15457]